MIEPGFLDVLGIFVVVSAAIVLLARVIQMPSIVSYLAAGLLVGPILGLVRPVEEHGALETLGELGIVLLMFLVGLELSLDRVRQVGKVAVAAGVGQVVFTALGGFGLCLALGFDVMESIFVSTALTFSSTVVVVKLLDQKNDLHALYGRIAVGIFLVQDLVVVVVLTFLAGLGSPDALEPAAVARNLGQAFGGMTLLLVGCMLASRFLLPRPLAWAAHHPRTLFLWSLAWCLAVVLTAQVMALSAEIGAFLAGMAIAQLHVAHELRRRLHPLMSFFIAVFFVSLGAGMELGAATAYWRETLALSLFVLIGNPFIFMLIIARYGYSERTCFNTSVTVAQISEFSFIFAAMGVSAGLVREEILAVVAAVGLVTIATSAYMILFSDPLYRVISGTGVLRIFRAKQEPDEEPPAETLSGHVVVVGMNGLGRAIALALHERGETVLAIDRDDRKLADLPCHTMAGDVEYLSMVEEAGLPEAALAVCALRIETTSRLFAYRCRLWGVPVALWAFDRSVLGPLQEVAPDFLIEGRAEAGRRLASDLAALARP